MTRVPSWAGAPVLSKMRPPRRTSVPSGPRGPGGTGTRRGSSDVGVSALRYFRRSCGFCCPGSAGEIRRRITLAAANAFQSFLIANRDIIFLFLEKAVAYSATNEERKEEKRVSRTNVDICARVWQGTPQAAALYLMSCRNYTASGTSCCHSEGGLVVSAALLSPCDGAVALGARGPGARSKPKIHGEKYRSCGFSLRHRAI